MVNVSGIEAPQRVKRWAVPTRAGKADADATYGDVLHDYAPLRQQTLLQLTGTYRLPVVHWLGAPLTPHAFGQGPLQHHSQGSNYLLAQATALLNQSSRRPENERSVESLALRSLLRNRF